MSKHFKEVFKRFALWASTSYVIANACINCRKAIKSLKDIDDTLI